MFKVTMHQPSNGGGYSLSTLSYADGVPMQIIDYARNASPVSPHTAMEVLAAAEADGKATIRLIPVGRNPIHTPAAECRTITVGVA